MSTKFSLSAQDIRNWLKNLLIFVAPVLLIYVLAVTGIITGHNGVVALSDFVPNGVTVGAMVLYVLNAVIDILRKFSGTSTSTPLV